METYANEGTLTERVNGVNEYLCSLQVQSPIIAAGGCLGRNSIYAADGGKTRRTPASNVRLITDRYD